VTEQLTSGLDAYLPFVKTILARVLGYAVIGSVIGTIQMYLQVGRDFVERSPQLTVRAANPQLLVKQKPQTSTLPPGKKAQGTFAPP
jgi:hypothetical protein